MAALWAVGTTPCGAQTLSPAADTAPDSLPCRQHQLLPSFASKPRRINSTLAAGLTPHCFPDPRTGARLSPPQHQERFCPSFNTRKDSAPREQQEPGGAPGAPCYRTAAEQLLPPKIFVSSALDGGGFQELVLTLQRPRVPSCW